MACERDRILKLIEYIESLGVEVNWGKNKAQGKKGFFRVKSDVYRIDISKELTYEEALSVLVHEFSHYFHYLKDNTLKSLNFLGEDMDEVLMEELILLTVNSIPKKTISPLFEMQNNVKNDIKNLQRKKWDFVANFELKNKQRVLKKINYRIAKINRYYNSLTELYARSMECYVFNTDYFKKTAPNLYSLYLKFNKNDKIMLNFLNCLLK